MKSPKASVLRQETGLGFQTDEVLASEKSCTPKNERLEPENTPLEKEKHRT